MLGAIFEPFITASPVSVMARGLAERLLQPERLDAWFESLDTPQYTRDLLFSSGLDSYHKCITSVSN